MEASTKYKDCETCKASGRILYQDEYDTCHNCNGNRTVPMTEEEAWIQGIEDQVNHAEMTNDQDKIDSYDC